MTFFYAPRMCYPAWKVWASLHRRPARKAGKATVRGVIFGASLCARFGWRYASVQWVTGRANP